ncbi:MAG: alpha/beta hydrolase [Chitinophagaceae bacterium]
MRLIFLATAVLAGGLLLQSCNNESDTTNGATDSASKGRSADIKTDGLHPKDPKPEWAPDIDDEMWAVMLKLQSFNAPPLESLSPAEARKQPTPTDAVKALMQENNIAMPPSGVDTSGKEIPVKGGTIHARIYTPKTMDSLLPVIVYYHGGGWVIADLDVYDASPRALAEQTGAVVVSVHYRQAPENKFPTAHEDAFAAYQWVLKNATSFKGNPKKVAVAGESAGGNMACNVSIMARDRKIMLPAGQLLVYPVANNDMNSESFQKYANSKPLSKPLLEWMVKQYLTDPAKAAAPRIALVKADLKGLPSTTIIAAEIDLLATEGKLLADKLKDAGVEVNYKMYNGVTHEFFGMATVVPDAKDAQAVAASDLKKVLK